VPKLTVTEGLHNGPLGTPAKRAVYLLGIGNRNAHERAQRKWTRLYEAIQALEDAGVIRDHEAIELRRRYKEARVQELQG